MSWAIRSLRQTLLWGVGVCTAVLLGCSSNRVDGPDAELQQRLIVATAPGEIRSLKDVYTALLPGETVTVVGRIYAEGMSPFDARESIFTIIELPKPGHNHEDPGDCPFCKHELKNAKMAIVRVIDPSGKPYSRPADQLLGLRKSQDVSVTGTASLVGDTLMIDLQQLHELSSEAAAEFSKVIHQEPASADSSEGDSSGGVGEEPSNVDQPAPPPESGTTAE